MAARHLTPAVTTALDTDQPLTTTWTTTLADTLGTERAEHLQSSRWWPALIAAIDHGVRQGWTPTDLLTAGTNDEQQVDDCLALVWRISMFTDPPTLLADEPERPHPADEPPADLWDGFEPANPILIGNPVGDDKQVPLDIVEAPFDGEGDEDRGDNLWLQAMIRDTRGVPEPTDQDIRRMFERADAWRDCPFTPERLAEINQLTAAFYADRFPGSWAQSYLESRFGTDLTGHAQVQPGYAPAGWTTLVQHLHTLGVTEDEMLAAGVATTASTGRLIDRFRDRAVFPIRHEGVILGFVGRRHPDRTDHDKTGPKYLNTADTPLFHKGDQLYTPRQTWDPDATPVIVEGPMDAIAVTLATDGKYLGVAPLGTSLTDEQAAQLRLLGYRTPIVATDADLAGRVAARARLLDPHPLRPPPPLRRPARQHRPRRPPRQRTGRRTDRSARPRGPTGIPAHRRTVRPPPRGGRRPRLPPRHCRPTPRALGDRRPGHRTASAIARHCSPHHPRRPRHRVERESARLP